MIKTSISVIGTPPFYGIPVEYRKNYVLRFFRFQFWYSKPISLEEYRSYHE